MKANLKHLNYVLATLVILIFSIFSAYSQLIVDAGNDTTYCAGYGNEETKILGENVIIQNGTEPYKITWKCNKKISQHTTFTASDFLNDTTLLTPQITPNGGLGKIVFYLSITDQMGLSATDSIIIDFSQCACATGYIVIEIELGDSVFFPVMEPNGKYSEVFLEPDDGLCYEDSIGAWYKPEVTTNYNIVMVDTFGCTCSCHAYEVRVKPKTEDDLYEYVPFPHVNAIWSESYHSSSDTEEMIYEQYSISGQDTVLNGKMYKKLYVFNDSSFNINSAFYIGGIREDSLKRVYYRGEIIHHLKPFEYVGDEILLYDFSLEVSDTLKTGNFFPDQNGLVVNKIDTVFIGGKLRKRFSFERYQWVTWIEGIGNLDGLLFSSGDMPTSNLSSNLRCLKLNDTLIYMNEFITECIPLVDNIDLIKSEEAKIKLFPNPTGDYIYIQLQDNNISKNTCVDIYNIQGDCVLSVELTDMIFVGDLKPGIYFLKINMPKQELQFKFVKK